MAAHLVTLAPGKENRPRRPPPAWVPSVKAVLTRRAPAGSGAFGSAYGVQSRSTVDPEGAFMSVPQPPYDPYRRPYGSPGLHHFDIASGGSNVRSVLAAAVVGAGWAEEDFANGLMAVVYAPQQGRLHLSAAVTMILPIAVSCWGGRRGPRVVG
jgi:hypothetical protein